MCFKSNKNRFYVSGHVARKYSRGPNFFKKVYLSKFFVAKVKIII